MAPERKALQWAPVYLDEFQSREVRCLSTGARELWVAISCRTRTAVGGPESKKGFFVSYEALAKDLSRWSKSKGKLVPPCVRTIKRYAAELKAAELLEVRANRGPAYLVVLRPPSLRTPKPLVATPQDERAARYANVPQRGQNLNKKGQNGSEEVTRMGVTYSEIHNSHNFQTDEGTFEKDKKDKSVGEMAKWMIQLNDLAKHGSKEDRFKHLNPALRETFSQLKCRSWHEAAIVAPQAVRGCFAKWRPEGISESEFDGLIAKAGRCARASCEEGNKESPVVRGYRQVHPELELPMGCSEKEADEILQKELSRRTGF